MNENIDKPIEESLDQMAARARATDYSPGDKVRRPPPGVVVRIVCDKCGSGGTLKKLGEHRYRCMSCWKKFIKGEIV